MKPETLVAQAGHAIDAETGAIVPPIHLSTTYSRRPGYQLIDGRDYSRDLNPTYLQAERILAGLDGGEEAMVFASGMTAATLALRAHLRPGAHAILPKVCYFGVRSWATKLAARWGFELSLVDTTNVDEVRAAMRPNTAIVWLETPANPTWDVSDIAAIAELCKASGARLGVDSTCGTPVHQKPIALGADIVMHSATKYLAGHSDVIAGALVTAKKDDVWNELHGMRREEGAVLGPFEAFLLLRGMRTLFARVERQSKTAMSLAQRLAEITTVRYPGLPSHPQHAIAKKQMLGGFGGMLSIQTGGGAAKAIEVIEKLKIFVRTTSLGGVESLAEHRFSVEGANTPTPPDLIRLSIGLEHEDDLFDDLREALS